MKKKVYLFDLDGTLIDSMTFGWKRTLLSYLDEQGVRYPHDIIKKVAALGLRGVAKCYKEELSAEGDEQSIYAELIAKMQEAYNHTIPAKPNAEKILKKLKDEGAVLCVLTAGVHALFDPCLKRLGLTEYFDYLWSTEEFPVNKADPAIYDLIAKRLGVEKEDCARVDDSIAALKPAKSAGV